MDRQRGDQYSLEKAQIIVQIAPALTEVEDGITDQLPRSVVGRLAASVNGLNRVRQRHGCGEAGAVRSAPDRVDRLVLEEKQRVWRCGWIRNLRADERLLPIECGRIREPAEPFHMERLRSHICIMAESFRSGLACSRR